MMRYIASGNSVFTVSANHLLQNEMDREDMKHHFTMLMTEGLLHLAPIGPNPETILDIGTGTGKISLDKLQNNAYNI
jgi:ubiquinone/menaquinone biosynthesis C-methylase UbiE